ncbi:hypothetical protein BC629DRAFT_1520008 [Irpex lacteus]|nr:hypothetical protein BC629DRAFT_1520008 [Irpex lacteus]
MSLSLSYSCYQTGKFQQQGPEILLTMDGRQVGTSSTMSIFTTNPYRDGDDFEDFRVEGVLVYIEDQQLPVDLVALRKQLIAHESLRVVYFVFRAQSILWSMVRTMNLEGFDYIRSELQMPVEGDGPKFGLGCRRSKSLSYEEIDHIKGTYMDDSTTCFDMDLDTLQRPWWDDDDAMMFAFLGRE